MYVYYISFEICMPWSLIHSQLTAIDERPNYVVTHLIFQKHCPFTALFNRRKA